MDQHEYELRQRAQAELDGIDEVLEERRQRQASPEWQWPVSEMRHAPVPPPRPREPEHKAEERIRAERVATAERVAAAANTKTLTDAIAKTRKQLRGEMIALALEIGKDIDRLEDRTKAAEQRATKSETALTELLMECERRLAALEQRAMLKPIKPKLVDDDAA